jgi:hypothetical protein
MTAIAVTNSALIDACCAANASARRHREVSAAACELAVRADLRPSPWGSDYVEVALAEALAAWADRLEADQLGRDASRLVVTR